MKRLPKLACSGMIVRAKVCVCVAFVFSRDDYHHKLCCFGWIWFIPVRLSVRGQ